MTFNSILSDYGFGYLIFFLTRNIIITNRVNQYENE